MEYRSLGNTGLSVSRLCFGALTIGPLQRNLSLTEGAKVIRHALEGGVNFIDTGELYQTYPYIRKALEGFSQEVIIATKSYAYTREDMEASIDKARTELNRDVIDLFLLHEQESEHTLRGHWPAFEVLMEAKSRGIVKAIGLSTHYVQAVVAGAKVKEVDVISPLINHQGIGIQGGNREQMLVAIKDAADNGKGIYAMKPLGGGHLISSWQSAFDFLLQNPAVPSIAVGMKSREEVEFNLAYFNDGTVSSPLEVERMLHIESWCVGCGRCVEKCPMQALRIEEGRAVNDPQLCVFCGYCGASCQDFAIKVI